MVMFYHRVISGSIKGNKKGPPSAIAVILVTAVQ